MPKKQRKSQAKMRHSIRKTAMAYTAVVMIVMATTLSVCSFFVARSLLSQRISAQLSSLVSGKEPELEAALQTDRERTALLGSTADVLRVLAGAGNGPLQDVLVLLESQQIDATGVAVYDARGVLRGSAGKTMPQSHALTESTVLIPEIGARGWESHIVYAPIQGSRGTVAVRYDVARFLDSFLSVEYVGNTARMFLGRTDDGKLTFLNFPFPDGTEGVLTLSSLAEERSYELPMAEAVSGKEGVGIGKDHRGKKVFAAYRSMPSLGWGLVVQVDIAEALSGISALAAALFAIALLTLALTGIVGAALIRRLTGPILRLAAGMEKLRPGFWSIKRSVYSGDEVELLETVAVDMAKRLKGSYEMIEDEIVARTSELKTQYLKDRTILETIDHGVVLIDSQGRVTGTNAAALSVLKCPADYCLGQKVQDSLDIRLHRKSLTGKDHPVLYAMRKKEAVRSGPETRYSIMRGDNILIPVSLVIKPLIQSDKVIGAVAVFQDITEERRVDYLKSEFISLASHQLRTPLSSLQWYVELFAEEKDVSKDQREYLNEMKIAAKRMSDLIDALLHAARLEGGNITPQSNETDVTVLVTELAEELRTMAKEKNIACTIDIPGKHVEMRTDSVLLHVVFKNLFSNAVKYTPLGGQVGVKLRADSKHLNIQVSDTGIGIPKAERKRLFERLFRASNVRKLDTDGNGLGLYITKMIIDSLGGTIGVESEEGKGSVFSLRLPLVQPKKNLKKAKTQGL